MKKSSTGGHWAVVGLLLTFGGSAVAQEATDQPSASEKAEAQKEKTARKSSMRKDTAAVEEKLAEMEA